MADTMVLLVEALYQLRSSIDVLGQDQAQAREEGIGSSLTLAIIDGLSEMPDAIDKLATQQAEFQRDVLCVLSDISRDIARVPEHIGTLDSIAHDVSLIADRYRPFESDLSP